MKLYDEHNNKKEIYPKKINFNEGVSNLNFIQNKNNVNCYNSLLKEDNFTSLFLSPTKPKNNNNIINYQNASVDPQANTNKNNIPPNTSLSNFDDIIKNNKNINNQINEGKIKEQNNSHQINLKENINLNYSLKNIKMVSCTCTKTQCQKKYCACYSFGKYCEMCNCIGCLNRPNNNYTDNNENRSNNTNKNDEENIQRNNCQDSKQTIVCNCTKSRCMKKYCECYKVQLPCGALCRCIDCNNKSNSYIYSNPPIGDYDNNINNQNINKSESKMNSFQNDYIEKLREASKYFTIMAMEIYISNFKLVINERIIDLDSNKISFNTTPKLTNKKRARGKTESNLKTSHTNVNSSKRKKKGYSHMNSNMKKKKLDIS